MSALQLGFGLGLRPHYYRDILGKSLPQVDWFEIISENYMFTRGRPLELVTELRSKFPIVMHGVGLAIGSTDPLSEKHLTALKSLAQRLEPPIVSDHLCWGQFGGQNFHDLLPLPLNEETLNHLIPRIQKVQEYLGRPLSLENVSSYVNFKSSSIPEWEFLNTLAERTGCGILLDINNAFVNAFNHGFDAKIFIDSIHPKHVKQFHIAGHTDKGTFLFDTHNAHVVPGVWDLYQRASARFPGTPTLLEWDQDFPPFENLLEEIHKARHIAWYT